MMTQPYTKQPDSARPSLLCKAGERTQGTSQSKESSCKPIAYIMHSLQHVPLLAMVCNGMYCHD